jgi:hypothetical protein
LANLILITTFFALPFAFSNIFWGLFRLDNIQEIAKDKTKITLIGTGYLFFLMIPILFVVEAILSWSSWALGKNRKCQDQESER